MEKKQPEIEKEIIYIKTKPISEPSIVRNRLEEDVSTPQKDDKIKCKFCDYMCKKKATMMKHVNTTYGHGHSEIKGFVENDK